MAYNMKGWSGFQNSPMKQKQSADPRKSPKEKEKAKKGIKELEKRHDFKKNELVGMISDIKFSAEGRSLTDSEKKQIANLQAQIAAL
jgi:hypothetical protein